jgi:hypothetical protein
MRKFLYGFIIANLLFLVFSSRLFKSQQIAYLIASGYHTGCVEAEVKNQGPSSGLIYLECGLKAADIYRTILLMTLKPEFSPTEV